ncbi:MAG: cell wall-binding repeat-containing protein [Coriobacteriales bacterium]|nr:cell wall-binding repeat-containing protein [Coriobacteriales bacterium]
MRTKHMGRRGRLLSVLLALALVGMVPATPAFADVAVPGDVVLAATAATNVTRHGGEDRYETAVEISKKAFTGTNPTVIVAYGGRFPDALAGSGLAGAVSAPILLADLDELPQATADELKRLNPSKVYLLGSTAALSDKVAEQIAALPLPTKPQIIRLGGETRYETARLIADEVVAQGGSTTEAYLAYGAKFADAASLSSFAASQKIPILLGDETGLHAQSSDFIKIHSTQSIVIAGSEAAVSLKAEGQLSDLGVQSVQRFGGADRFATCEKVATTLTAKYNMTVFLIGVAIGEGDRFPDALTGGAAAGVRGGVVIISSSTESDFVTKVVTALAGSNKPRIEVYGSEGALPEFVEADLGVVAPKPAWNDDFPKTYIGTKGGYIEVKDGKFYVYTAGTEFTTEQEVRDFHSDTYFRYAYEFEGEWSYYGPDDRPYVRSQEFYVELFDRCNLAVFNGKFGSYTLAFSDISYYLEHYGDGRKGVVNGDPNELFVFL